MSEDLISRSALMEEIENLRVTVTGLRAGKGILHEFMEQYKASVLKIIDEAPTAYDVDKVVEQLEDAKSMVPVNRLLDDIIKDKPKELGQLMAYDKAIKIVKAGGAE